MNYVIAFSHERYHNIFLNMPQCSGREFVILKGKNALTFEKLNEIKPKYVFFPHWSYIVPPEIYENFECIIFHMTDVPFGRGGSPLQNLISRGIYETKISAIKCSAGIDAGPVYMKKPFSLYGSAEEIYIRAGELIKEIITEIIEKGPVPVEQKGEPVYFARRKPDDGNIAPFKELNKVFDYIRMLDADGYPNAFLETEYFKLEFQRPALKSGKLVADVIITQKQKDKDE